MSSNPTARWLGHLRRDHALAALSRGGQGLSFEDAALHDEAWSADPELYALSALGASPAQQERVLHQLLAASWSGFAPPRRALLERVIAALSCSLPAERVLAVFLGLRQRRANHKHGARAVLRYLLRHPARASLARARRPAVVECLEHALGRDVARRCGRVAAEASTPADEAYLRQHVLRHAPDARALLAFLYRAGPAPAGELSHRNPPAPLAPVVALETGTINAFNRGELAAALTHVYRGGETPELRAAIASQADHIAAGLPVFSGRMGLVLDASASTQGYGEREHCCIAQSVALALVLERACRELVVRVVGGAGDPPAPGGSTNLAAALLDLLEQDPDVVAVVTDGYENQHAGDLGRVVAALPAAGIATPVVVIHSKFTFKDDLSLRRPAADVPELEMWHERDFEGVYLALMALARGEHGRDGWKRHAERQLTAFERRNESWMSASSRR